MARIPKLCRHKQSGLAYVTDPASGKEAYLGKYGTAEADAAYGAWVQTFLKRATRHRKQYTKQRQDVSSLLVAYLEHADTYYRKHGQPTSETHCLNLVAKHMHKACGPVLLTDFTPDKLKKVRAAMIEAGYTRESINKHVHRIRRIFRWGVEQGLVSSVVLGDLEAVAPLAKGRSPAPESEPVRPVSIEVVEQTLLHVRKPVVADLVRFQLATGCRPQDVVRVRMCDIDQNKTPWLYVPYAHKTEHHGQERKIWLGPKARAIVSARERQVSAHLSEWLFQVPWHKSGKSAGRYTTQSYRRAIERACARAKVPRWTPGQLRHTAGTLVREKYGLEGAQVVLGHEDMDVTQIYAEQSASLARRIAEDMG